MAMAFGLRYAPSQPAGPQDSASAEAHCLQASSSLLKNPETEDFLSLGGRCPRRVIGLWRFLSRGRQVGYAATSLGMRIRL